MTKEKNEKENKEPRNFARRFASDYHIWRTIFYYIVLVFMVFPVQAFYYNLKVEGRKNLPKKRNVIYVGNHVSELDPPFVGYAVARPIAFMAKKELFEGNSVKTWLVKRLGAFAVNREKPELATFKTVKEIFNTSWGLGIFPQGGTRKNKKIEDIHKGFVLFAKKFNADIVPISICGLEEYSKKFRGRDVNVIIGKPISYQLPEDEIVRLWCEEICKNTGYENCVTGNNQENTEEVKEG